MKVRPGDRRQRGALIRKAFAVAYLRGSVRIYWSAENYEYRAPRHERLHDPLVPSYDGGRCRLSTWLAWGRAL